MLCQGAHGQCVVPFVVFEVVCFPPSIAVAAFLSGVPDRLPRVVHPFFLSGVIEHSLHRRTDQWQNFPARPRRAPERPEVPPPQIEFQCPSVRRDLPGGQIRPEPANSPWAVIRRAGDLAAPSIMLGMAEDANQHILNT